MSTATGPRPTGPRTGRHPVHVGHLVMGLALLGLFTVWALVQADAVGRDDVRWLLPVPWVVAGAVGLAVTAVAGARRGAASPTGSTGPSTMTGWVEPADARPASPRPAMSDEADLVGPDEPGTAPLPTGPGQPDGSDCSDEGGGQPDER